MGHPAHATKARSQLRRRLQIHLRCAVQYPALMQTYDLATSPPQSAQTASPNSQKIVLGKDSLPSSHVEGLPRLLRLKREAADPDQWPVPETENPVDTGVYAVSNFNMPCQTLIFCVNLYSTKPASATPAIFKRAFIVFPQLSLDRLHGESPSRQRG